MAKSTQKIPWRVFVSSTREDLIPYREAAIKALTSLEQIPVGMDYFVSSSDKPIDVCLATVRRSQLYIVIVGMRYGSIEEGSGKSYTELEYDEAVKNKLPVLAFIIDENECAILPRFVDTGEKAEKLSRFKEKLRGSYLVSKFKSAEDLERLVSQSVKQAIEQAVVEEKKAESEEQANEISHYLEGAKMYKRFIMLPKRYCGQEVTLRVRMQGQFASWRLRDELFEAFGFEPGNAIYGNDAVVIGVDMSDVDLKDNSIDFFAGGTAADWIITNEVTTGVIFEGKFRFAYERVEGVASRDYGSADAYIAALILVEGKTVIGKEAGKRRPKGIPQEMIEILSSK